MGQADAPGSPPTMQTAIDSLRLRVGPQASMGERRRDEEPLHATSSVGAQESMLERRRNEEPFRVRSSVRASSASAVTTRRGPSEPTLLTRIEQFRRDVLDGDGVGSDASSQQTSRQFQTGTSPVRTNASNGEAVTTSSSQRAGDAFAALRAIGALRDGGFVSAGDGSLTTALHAVARAPTSNSESIDPLLSR